jgi:S1-C subfamily serine protease
MSEKDRNWWVGLLTIIVSFAVLAWSLLWLASPAGGNAPEQAGPVVKVEVGTSHGSGVHIGNGYVLTAEHVVYAHTNAPKDKPRPLTIRNDRGGEAEAEVLWSSDYYDVALLRTDMPLGTSELSCRPLIVGEPVTVLGNPKQMSWVQTWGRIGSAEQAVKDFWPRAVVVDVTTTTGSSGGPVLDADGRTVGIVVGGVSATGYNFSVPAPVICDLLAR